MAVHILGIRHHGPGCARALVQSLNELQPDIILLEGPNDADSILQWVADEALVPPVAMLIHPIDEPSRSVFYPFAEFSPEWQAMRWAAKNQRPLRMMDLPMIHRLALDRQQEEELKAAAEAAAAAEVPEASSNESLDESPDDSAEETSASTELTAEVDAALPPPETPIDEPVKRWRTDPIGILAEAEGYRDAERWWDERIEMRHDTLGMFNAILEAMQAVRGEFPETEERDALREAWMRNTIRAAIKEGFQSIAVICGAWHAPVLQQSVLSDQQPGLTRKEDTARLSGLPKVKTAATWIPWTYGRLTFRSGYGAGVRSPGWYEHLWRSRDQAAIRWVATAARLLRESDLDASSASVIEASRLADALAALRDLRSPGLEELDEAMLSVLCQGDSTPLQLIHRQLTVGNRLGEVPASAPAVPLAADIAREQKALRLKPSAESKTLDLDLRNDTDRKRSRLLYRLRLLGITWGEVVSQGSSRSTFHEIWKLEWHPEFAVSIVEASPWGSDVSSAATAKTLDAVLSSPDLSVATSYLDQVVVAGLDQAVDPILNRIRDLAAIGSDVRHLMAALPPLARVARYGDVRGTKADHLEPILATLFERVRVGLAPACSALDEAASAEMSIGIDQVCQALETLNRHDLQQEWNETLLQLIDRSIHAALAGRCCRLLFERRQLDIDELHRHARLALGSAVPPNDAAAWAAGLLRGSGMLLLHQDELWTVFDRWLRELHEEAFTQALPLLRRAFSDFSGAERKRMGEKVAKLSGGSISLALAPDHNDSKHLIDVERANLVLPFLAHLLGTDNSQGNL